MRKTLLAAAFAGIAAVAVTTPATAIAAPEVDGYIVVLRDTADASAVAAEHSRAQGAEVGHLYQNALRGYSARMSATAAARIARDSRVLWVQPDGVASIAAQTTPTGINRVDAELSPTARINGLDERVNVDVAVIDTGIDLDHPDLNVYTAGAKNCSTGSSADDGNGHGTHVSGTIGALDNSVGPRRPGLAGAGAQQLRQRQLVGHHLRHRLRHRARQ
jgi:subtilisin